MPEQLSHEEIAARFVESGALNFDAMGKFVAEMGPELVTRDQGLHGFVQGRFNSLACFMPAADLRHFFGGLRGAAGLADAVDLPQG